MRKTFLVLSAFTLIFFNQTDPASADSLVMTESGKLVTTFYEEEGPDFRAVRLKRYLMSHNSPLAEYSEEFVKYADKYNLDWRFVPAITGVESTFGKNIPFNSYNAYGWANGAYRFSSWEESIEHVNKTLREKYYDRGADTLPKIARRYAPPSNSWGWKVEFFMERIDPLPLEFDL